MTTVTIVLTDEDVELATEQAARRGYAGLEAYVNRLVFERLHGAEEINEDHGAPSHLCVSSPDHLEELIHEGLKSPAREMTRADFDQMRTELVDHHHREKPVG